MVMAPFGKFEELIKHVQILIREKLKELRERRNLVKFSLQN